MSAGVVVQDLAKEFETRDGGTVRALDSISLDIEPGSFACIAGPTGCGKTTLLRIIAGVEPSTAGSVSVDGRPVSGPRDGTGMVFQGYSLFPWRSVLDNVAFGLEMRGVGRADRRRRAGELLDLVGLAGSARSRPWELSGGMQQRAAIARALATDPDLLLMDEPFGALDERTRHRLQDELLALWQRTKKTVLFVTHSIDEAVYLGQRVVVLADRPSRVAGDFRFDLKRPRNRVAPEFVSALLQVRNLLERVVEEGNDESDGPSNRGGKSEKRSDTRGPACCGR
jgi:NitT/TauT family transport system ATP-binding protein